MELQKQLEKYINKLDFYQQGSFNNDDVETYKALEKVKQDIKKIIKTS